MARGDANNVPSVHSHTNLRDSQTRLIDGFQDLVRDAKRNGVKDPHTVIDAYIDRKSLSDVQLFGLRLGIVFTFASPVALYALKYHCAATHVMLDLPETTIMDFVKIQGAAVMAFGFGSVVHNIIHTLYKPKKEIAFAPSEDE